MSARALACALGVIVSCVASGQERPDGLTKNPFSRPGYMVQLQEAPAAAVFFTEPVELQLLATLVSSGRSLANLNGEVLAVGESYEGYRLLRVDEGRVVLLKDGERTTLDLHETTDRGEIRD